MAAVRRLEDVEDAGLTFVVLTVTYGGIVTVLIILYAVLVRHCERQLMRISACISRLLARKHLQLRAPLDIAFLGFLATPAVIFAICIILGPLVAAAENWSAAVGVEYILGNTMGLQQPLTEVSPVTSMGVILAIAVSAMGLLLVTVCLGIGQSLVSACRFWDFRNSIASFIFSIFVFNMILMALLCFIIGWLLSRVEGWELRDGFKFAVSQICQFPNSLTDVAPSTGWGSFIEVLCVSLQVLIQSIALDTIGSHPCTSNFIDYIEQKGVRMRASQKVVNQGDAPDRTEEAEVDVTEDAWKQRVRELERKLKEAEAREAEYQQQVSDLHSENEQLRKGRLRSSGNPLSL
mmetsp:Transcript_13090/g.24092  ORF Transcript_13090/g.24092 Transcript_13090/m.24092 type:complete len:349 (+) Transcript_13090:63-1109(+)